MTVPTTVKNARTVGLCRGKRSAKPLWAGTERRGKAPSPLPLCRRSPYKELFFVGLGRRGRGFLRRLPEYWKNGQAENIFGEFLNPAFFDGSWFAPNGCKH